MSLRVIFKVTFFFQVIEIVVLIIITIAVAECETVHDTETHTAYRTNHALYTLQSHSSDVHNIQVYVVYIINYRYEHTNAPLSFEKQQRLKKKHPLVVREATINKTSDGINILMRIHDMVRNILYIGDDTHRVVYIYTLCANLLHVMILCQLIVGGDSINLNTGNTLLL